MKLIVGLGNPGKEYLLTRHNMGFMVLEKIAKECSVKFRPNRHFRALTAECVIGGEECCLAKPQEFMNLSGYSVASAVRRLKIGLADILLIVDDIAIPFGSIKIRPKGTDAGHRGLRSVIDCLGTNEFARERIGIRGRDNIKDISRYVLSRFAKAEQKLLPDVLENASSACECWIREGVDKVMNRFNKLDGGRDEKL